MRWPSIAALRGALWITVIALIATGTALTVQYVQTIRLLDTRAQAAVDDETAGLIERYRAEGPLAVVQAVSRAVGRPRVTDFIYLMADANGDPIAGNLARWPDAIDRTGYRTFDTQITTARGNVIDRQVAARTVLLGGDYRLLVGSLSDDRRVLHDRYVAALAWSLVATGAIGLLFGFWYSRRGLAFLTAASAAGDRFQAGHLDERLPVTGRGDEYDRLAVTLNTSFTEIERLVDSLRTATDALAHDLKTPLTRIRARIELAALSDDPRSVALDSRSDLDALLRTIDDTLRLARAETTMASEFAPVDFAAIVREAGELFEPVADDRGVALTIETVPTVTRGVRSLLGQLVTNLLDNAIKYTPSGGRVTVTLELERDRTGLALTVADTGPGIAADQRDHALARFVRLDPSRHAEGSGLGLSIAVAAARVHGGTLTLGDNAPGLTVIVSLPSLG
ncbi:sensor histidine kinase [Sphingomonas echinoides]|uniref:sensor histidine kinase n=1 Tax=Sphingomonas echinoides TaxID=59803 RepID=UPI002413A7A3|nr:HAMP domain-containing sensor histidine kinase [Sphingomonas echinoides]